jgi:tRNA G10  N-methylase Trm11
MTRGSQMSFTELKITELRKIADSFGVDASVVKTKQEIIALLEEEGVNYETYSSFTKAEKQDIKIPEIEKKKRETKSVNKEKQVLVKMERMNFSYQVGKHTFTQDHPFLTMSEEEAQEIFDKQEGFRLATPREAQEFYA